MSKLDIEDLLDSGASGDEGDLADVINEQSHGRLVNRVKALYGSREAGQRMESSQKVSEFNFSREPSDAVTAFDMLKDLNNTAELKKKRNKVLKIKKKAALPVPLPKVSRERLQRAIGYAKTTNELGKWDSIVEHNQTADQLRFPLNDQPVRLEQSGDFVKQFAPSTELEAQVEALLSSSKHRLDTDACLSQYEEEQLKALPKEEALARLSELRRLRALMHAEALKNRRVRKIKSRKFHRIQRKDKMKAAIREFEQLKITDPQKALEKLEELERIRREERVSLRHKRKSKWAAQLAKTGKFDKEAQLALRERIELGRELETKVKLNDDEEDSDDLDGQGRSAQMDGVEGAQAGSSSGEEERATLERSLQEEGEKDDGTGEGNPWLRSTFFEEVKTGTATADASAMDSTVEKSRTVQKKKSRRSQEATAGAEGDVETPRKGANILRVPDHMMKPDDPAEEEEADDQKESKIKEKEGQGAQSRNLRSRPTAAKEEGSSAEESAEDDDELISENTERVDPYAPRALPEEIPTEKRLRETFDDEDRQSKRRREFETLASSSAVCIDPEKVLEVGESSEKKLKSKLRLSAAIGEQSSSEEESDDELNDGEGQRSNAERQRKLIQEAFAGDDVVEDFIKEQREKDASEREAEREAALKQKGLDGDWVTPNNINRLDDRKKKFLESRRKAFQPKAALIHEDADVKGIKNLRASEIPKGFRQVAQFESVLQQPVGSAFNTPSAFYELTKPRVLTTRGKIIRPIDHNALVRSIKAPDFKKGRPQRKAVQ